MTEEEKKKEKSITWWQSFIGAVIAYGLEALIGGIIGAAFGVVGLILLLFGIVAGFRVLLKNNKK
jgi:uncharacterized membrane-anchored protein